MLATSDTSDTGTGKCLSCGNLVLQIERYSLSREGGLNLTLC